MHRGTLVNMHVLQVWNATTEFSFLGELMYVCKSAYFLSTSLKKYLMKNQKAQNHRIDRLHEKKQCCLTLSNDNVSIQRDLLTLTLS